MNNDRTLRFLDQRQAWVAADRPACNGWSHWAQAAAQWSHQFGQPVAFPGGRWR